VHGLVEDDGGEGVHFPVVGELRERGGGEGAVVFCDA
jgi:hypothetical protein